MEMDIGMERRAGRMELGGTVEAEEGGTPKVLCFGLEDLAEQVQQAYGEQGAVATGELAVGNIVRRVLHIFHEEDLSLTNDALSASSLPAESDDAAKDDHPVLSASVIAAAARSALRPSLRACLTQQLLLRHVLLKEKANFEVILTLGSSRTVMEFLCAAKEKNRSFRVAVAEGAPRLNV
ncbi:hypothetical protein Salat_1678100 [Sesamum alatum]|uniref:Translation initiation factor eIF2B subunit beta n=1 Tax=Sesamum alatum TaxID=300844 RepID=A0AAE1Y769_9LAMI|nr:hypothetical protein Salat_1678100 [Sesamum alatum]